MARIKMINGTAHFYCLACSTLHRVDARFIFNYNMKSPTFKPEIKLSIGPFPEGHPLTGQTVECYSSIQDGIITYLEGSTHGQAGKKIGLPDFEELAAMFRAKEEAKKLQAFKVD